VKNYQRERLIWNDAALLGLSVPTKSNSMK